MTPSLEGPEAKLSRALEHLDTLSEEVAVFLGSKPYRAVYKFDIDKRDHVWRLQVHHSAPMRLGILAGDVIHNLRSSLDHLAWQLALKTTCTPYRRTGFPIYREPGPGRQCFDPDGLAQIKDLPGEAKEIIESVQPYDHHLAWHFDLWVLHQLSNLDKHRLVLNPIPQFSGATIGVGEHSLRADEVVIADRPVNNNGDELLRIGNTIPVDFEEQTEDMFHFDVGINSDERPFRKMSAVQLLARIHKIIDKHLFPLF